MGVEAHQITGGMAVAEVMAAAKHRRRAGEGRIGCVVRMGAFGGGCVCVCIRTRVRIQIQIQIHSGSNTEREIESKRPPTSILQSNSSRLTGYKPREKSLKLEKEREKIR